MGANMLGSEGPDQQRIRRITEAPFRPRDVEERTQGMIPTLAHELVDGFADRGEVDLFTAFCDPMSVRSLRFMLGLDEVPWEDLLALEPGDDAGPRELRGRSRRSRRRRIAASAELGAAIERVLDRLEDEPDGSVLSWMLHHDADGDRMTREEIVANTKLMLSGGLQEPRDLIALAVWALGSNPEQLDEVRDDRSLVKAAVEETLRWAGPVGTSTRQTTRRPSSPGVELRRGRADRRGARRRRTATRVGSPTPTGSTSTARRARTSRSRSGRISAWAPGSAGTSRASRSTSCSTACRTCASIPSGRSTLRGWEFRAPRLHWVRWDA